MLNCNMKPQETSTDYLCVYVFIEYDHIITYSIYYIHTYIWIHTQKCTYVHAHTHKMTEKTGIHALCINVLGTQDIL